MRYDWQERCAALWGDDWIAPLADVLAVNRRTVERWRSGAIEIPSAIADEIVRLPALGGATSAYGAMLRRMALGESVADMEDWIADHRRALLRLKSDIGKFSAINVLVAGRRNYDD